VELHLHLHLGHLADAFIQSDLQRVHLLKEREQYITLVPERVMDKRAYPLHAVSKLLRD